MPPAANLDPSRRSKRAARASSGSQSRPSCRLSDSPLRPCHCSSRAKAAYPVVAASGLSFWPRLHMHFCSSCTFQQTSMPVHDDTPEAAASLLQLAHNNEGQDGGLHGGTPITRHGTIGRPRLEMGSLQKSWRYFAVDLSMDQAEDLARAWLRLHFSDQRLAIRRFGWKKAASPGVPGTDITFAFHHKSKNNGRLSTRTVQKLYPMCADRTWTGFANESHVRWTTQTMDVAIPTDLLVTSQGSVSPAALAFAALHSLPCLPPVQTGSAPLQS